MATATSGPAAAKPRVPAFGMAGDGEDALAVHELASQLVRIVGRAMGREHGHAAGGPAPRW
jgi:hypothetical protein